MPSDWSIRFISKVVQIIMKEHTFNLEALSSSTFMASSGCGTVKAGIRS
jgi:hypothetical protein